MQENKLRKISVLKFMIILIIIVVSVIFTYKFYSEKIETRKKLDILQYLQENNLNELKSQNNNIYENIYFNNLENDTTTTNEENKTISSTSNNLETNFDFAREYMKIINRIENECSENDIMCDLIYFNNDNIPDLLIENAGYWVSLYIYENGEIYNLIDEWVYGDGGNSGYQYQEKKGTILNYSTDFAGAIISKNILILNLKNEFDTLLVTQRGANGENINNKEIDEALEAYGGHFYNNKKISEQEYNNKLKVFSIDMDETNYKELNGNRSTIEVKKQLQQCQKGRGILTQLKVS